MFVLGTRWQTGYSLLNFIMKQKKYEQYLGFEIYQVYNACKDYAYAIYKDGFRFSCLEFHSPKGAKNIINTHVKNQLN